jgi:hypothetical protein
MLLKDWQPGLGHHSTVPMQMPLCISMRNDIAGPKV